MLKAHPAFCIKAPSAVQKEFDKVLKSAEILIPHKLSGELLSPWKLTTEDKPQTLIDLESWI